MASRFDEQLARDFPSSHAEMVETVIRRIGGQDSRTEDVDAIVERDSKVAVDRGGLIDTERGQFTESTWLLEIAADQECTQFDTWVIDGKAWMQIGEPIGEDGGSKTLVLQRRKGVRGREPRTTNRRN